MLQIIKDPDGDTLMTYLNYSGCLNINEYNNNRISGSMHFSLISINQDRLLPELYQYKNKENSLIIIYDQQERISKQVANSLCEKGYKNIYLLIGGIMEFVKNYSTKIEGNIIKYENLISKSSSSIDKSSISNDKSSLKIKKYNRIDSRSLYKTTLSNNNYNSNHINNNNNNNNSDIESVINSMNSNLSVAETIISKASARKQRII